MSGQILVERKRYYEVLQKVQLSSGGITGYNGKHFSFAFVFLRKL